ncbi:hypothetical protein [Paraburkholderia sp. RL17-368-BIF-A]|uniref:hypothetical protein n=1 Tax=Paraburkholderia sp. RL17-368-BIF-A TaxID=3031628 RepID=UPI0038CD7648
MPLPNWAHAVLRELVELKRNSRYLFSSSTNLNKTMSENTVIFALYRMGYHSRMTGTVSADSRRPS